MSKKYSVIRLSNWKAHILNQENGELLCGTDKFKNSPFTINKTIMDTKAIRRTFAGYIARRGGPNPHKFTCRKCISAI